MCTESYKQIFYSLTFTASSLPSLPLTAAEASPAAAVTAMVMMVKLRTK